MHHFALFAAAAVAAALPQSNADVCALPAAYPEVGVEMLSFLAGNWVETKGDVAVREHWSGPFGGTLLGTSITTKANATKSYEFFRIAKSGSGISYFSSPNAAQPTEFKATMMCSNEVIFENRAHDFPQRIIYRRGPNGTLDARIEGKIKGKLEGEDWHYKAE